MMKKIFLFLPTLLLALLPLQGQDLRTLLRENPERYANIHHSYEAPEAIVDTPAPKGYEPFYVSHYGRHGSRYMTSMKSVTRVSHLFDSLDSLQLLTDEGKETLEQLDAAWGELESTIHTLKERRLLIGEPT